MLDPVTSQPPSRSKGEAEAPSRPRRPVLVLLGLAVVLSLLVGAAVGAPDYLPTNDGPQHVFTSYAARHLDDETLGYGRYLRPGATFSQVGFDQLFGGLTSMLTWRSALRVTLVVMVVAWAWGVMALAAAVGGRQRMWLGLGGFAVAVQWQVYMGLFSFYLAVGFGFYVLALAMWRTPWSARWRLLLSAALACQALLHPMPAIATSLVLVILCAWQVRRAELLREAGRLLLMGVPAMLVVWSSVGSVKVQAVTSSVPLVQRATVAVTAFASGPWWRAWPLPVLALAAAGLAVAGRPWRRDRRQGALLTAGLAFALVAALGPHDLANWQFFHMRFTPMATLLLLMLLPVERWPRAVRLVGLALLVLFAVASNLWALGYGRRLRAASADLLSGLEAPIRRSGMRLPLILEPRAGEPQWKPGRTIPYGTANWNVGALYAVAQGGVPAYAFAESERLHAVVWRWPEREGLRPPRPERGFEWSLSEPNVLANPTIRVAEINYLLSFAPHYEDVIFYGRPDEVVWLARRNFAIDYQRGGLAIARFRACPATLTLAAGPLGHAATIASFGWAPSVTPSLSRQFPAAPSAASPRTWRVGESPCGEVWFRVLFDNDGDGRVSAGDDTCHEADPQGFVLAQVSEVGAQVPCHPGRPLLPK